jgi:hypothetical protein
VEEFHSPSSQPWLAVWLHHVALTCGYPWGGPGGAGITNQSPGQPGRKVRGHIPTGEFLQGRAQDAVEQRSSCLLSLILVARDIQSHALGKDRALRRGVVRQGCMDPRQGS